MALKSKHPDVFIPDNVSWPQYVYRHFDKYGNKTAIVSKIIIYIFRFLNRSLTLTRASIVLFVWVFELRFEERSQRETSLIETT